MFFKKILISLFILFLLFLFNPINAETTWRQVRFNTFVQERLWFKDDKMQNVPDLAESLPDKSNSREVIIKIKENARWQDGREITAGDVVFSFQLYRDCEISDYSYVANKLVVEQIDSKTLRIKPEEGTSSFMYYVNSDNKGAIDLAFGKND